MNFVHVHMTDENTAVVAVPVTSVTRLLSYGLVRWDGSRYTTHAHPVAILQAPGAFLPRVRSAR